MRLKSLINEEEKSRETFTLFITNIINDCQPYLKIITKESNRLPLLYSGRKRDTDWFEQTLISERTPKDMAVAIHKDLDDEFLKQHGWRARSNVLFCTGDPLVTTEYGKEYMIFPKGNFKFLWSPKIVDLFIYMQRAMRELLVTRLPKGYENKLLYYFYDKLMKKMGDDFDESLVRKEYDKFITDLVGGYKSTDLPTALDSRHEIMVNCKSYYAVNYRKWQGELRRFLFEYGHEMPSKERLEYFFNKIF